LKQPAVIPAGGEIASRSIEHRGEGSADHRGGIGEEREVEMKRQPSETVAVFFLLRAPRPLQKFPSAALFRGKK
jgi:hypothetical protein